MIKLIKIKQFEYAPRGVALLFLLMNDIYFGWVKNFVTLQKGKGAKGMVWVNIGSDYLLDAELRVLFTC